MRALLALALAVLLVGCKDPEIPPVWLIPPGEIDPELWREVCGGAAVDDEDDWSRILTVTRAFSKSSPGRRRCVIYCTRDAERGQDVAICDEIRLYADTRDDMERLAARIGAPMVPPAVRRRMPEIIDRRKSASVPVGPFVLGGGYVDEGSSRYSLEISCSRCEPSPLPPLPAPAERR